MNIAIENDNSRIIDSISTSFIKTLSGEYTKEELELELVNYTYNKVVIDITSIKNYYDISSTLYFLSCFEPQKVILLLNNSELINSNSYLSHLIEKGYYNFTKNAAGVSYLIDHPNSLNDVINYTKSVINNNTSDESCGYTYENINNGEKTNYYNKNSNQKIIGIQGLTPKSGATTLMYMMVKQLNYNYHCKGIEMSKQDAIYFRDNNISMCTGIDDLKLKLKGYNDMDAVIIDLNGTDGSEFCDDTLYLIEPGIIGINKLIKSNSNVYEKTRNGKIILNRSAIKDEELTNFEYETKFKVFFNLSNFNERKERLKIIDILLIKLGFKRQNKI